MKRQTLNRWYVFSLVFQLGFSLAVPLVVGIGSGVWLDRQFHSTPRFTLLGVVVGLVLSGYSFYYEVLPLLQNNAKEKK